MPRSLERMRPRSVAREDPEALRFRPPEMAGMAEPGGLRHPLERSPARLAGRVEMAVPAAQRVWVEMAVPAGPLLLREPHLEESASAPPVGMAGMAAMVRLVDSAAREARPSHGGLIRPAPTEMTASRAHPVDPEDLCPHPFPRSASTVAETQTQPSIRKRFQPNKTAIPRIPAGIPGQRRIPSIRPRKMRNPRRRSPRYKRHPFSLPSLS
jgi:hypothetical protein